MPTDVCGWQMSLRDDRPVCSRSAASSPVQAAPQVARTPPPFSTSKTGLSAREERRLLRQRSPSPARNQSPSSREPPSPRRHSLGGPVEAARSSVAAAHFRRASPERPTSSAPISIQRRTSPEPSAANVRPRRTTSPELAALAALAAAAASSGGASAGPLGPGAAVRRTSPSDSGAVRRPQPQRATTFGVLAGSSSAAGSAIEVQRPGSAGQGGRWETTVGTDVFRGTHRIRDDDSMVSENSRRSLQGPLRSSSGHSHSRASTPSRTPRQAASSPRVLAAAAASVHPLPPVETVTANRSEVGAESPDRPLLSGDPFPAVSASSSSAKPFLEDGSFPGRALGVVDEFAENQQVMMMAADAPARAPRPFLKRAAGRGAAGAQGRSQQAKCSHDLIGFLRGTQPDPKGRLLVDILKWDDDRMEKVHDYIQWIFPTNEASKHNLGAPLLTPQLRKRAATDPQVLACLRLSFERFCAFLGLEVLWDEDEGSDVKRIARVKQAEFFESRIQVCWHTKVVGNHNWLRVSRVLHCLRLLGLEAEAATFMVCLEDLHDQGYPLSNAVKHWRKRASTPLEQDF